MESNIIAVTLALGKMSGVYGSFKFPSLIKRRRIDHGLPLFDWKSLTVVEQLARQWRFWSIHHAKYEGNEGIVVIKKLKSECSDPEVALLRKERCFSL